MLMVLVFLKKKSVKILNLMISLIDASFWISLDSWISQKLTDNQIFINTVLSISLFSDIIILSCLNSTSFSW